MIKISDMTTKQAVEGFSLTFREKIEIAKLLDKLGVSVIEVEGHHGSRADSLRIKSIATAVTDSVVAAPVELNADSIEKTWDALRQAKHPRLQVCASVSAVQMEYLFHKKPEAMLKAIEDTVRHCAQLADTEFIALDATRSECEFLYKAVACAIDAGASTVTVADSAARILLIIINIWIGIPYIMLMATGILMNIPADLYESSRVDGANAFQQYTRITLPYMLFVTGPYLLTSFVGNLNNFNVIYLLTQGNPLNTQIGTAGGASIGSTDLLITWLFKMTLGSTDSEYYSASIIGILIFVVVAFLSLIVYNVIPSTKNEEDFK